MALGPGLEGEEEALVWALEREGEVTQQGVVVLHEQRGHRFRVLQHKTQTKTLSRHADHALKPSVIHTDPFYRWFTSSFGQSGGPTS